MSSDTPELAQPLVGVEGLAWVGLRRLTRKIDLVIGTVSEAAGAGLVLAWRLSRSIIAVCLELRVRSNCTARPARNR